ERNERKPHRVPQLSTPAILRRRRLLRIGRTRAHVSRWYHRRRELAKRRPVVELRRYERTPIDIAVDFSPPGSTQRSSGRGSEISLGGMFIETSTPQAFSTEIVVHVWIPGQRAELAIPGVVRWARDGGMGV